MSISTIGAAGAFQLPLPPQRAKDSDEATESSAEKAREKLASVGRQLRDTSQGLLDGLGAQR